MHLLTLNAYNDEQTNLTQSHWPFLSLSFSFFLSLSLSLSLGLSLLLSLLAEMALPIYSNNKTWALSLDEVMAYLIRPLNASHHEMDSKVQAINYKPLIWLPQQASTNLLIKFWTSQFRSPLFRPPIRAQNISFESLERVL